MNDDICKKHKHKMRNIGPDMHGRPWYVCSSCASESGQETRLKVAAYDTLTTDNARLREELAEVKRQNEWLKKDCEPCKVNDKLCEALVSAREVILSVAQTSSIGSEKHNWCTEVLPVITAALSSDKCEKSEIIHDKSVGQAEESE